ncbi:hypothetical protein [Autumnicola musiva]|uniref:Transposase n=1 Tax=Autumnicola musiva TaxID=3075589 RepID=A0ABU3D4Z0_9FLAO|nr:hypothetical protein [Zunongwangia sp. F117]MDT0676590.1 hypothetical protein [Zunongwangia sp. F117]
MQTQSTQFDFTGQNIYVGIDTHLKSWNVTVMMDPYYQKTFSQNANAQTLLNHLEENYLAGVTSVPMRLVLPVLCLIIGYWNWVFNPLW